MSKLRINPAVSYRVKNDIYVFYYDFNYWFFSGVAAAYIVTLLESLAQGKDPIGLPESFLNYCKAKQIVLAVRS
ncbi:MAG: hypothetical protein V1838_05460 [Patescibacteria group bacterium]